MIRRNSLNYTKNQETLNQSSATALKGIDATKAPTTPDTVLNIDNLDVDYDGGLILRKPLIMSEDLENLPDLSNSEKLHRAFRLYNGDLIYIIKKDNSYRFYSKTKLPIYVEATDIEGNTVQKPVSAVYGLFDLSDVSIINTNTSTVLGNVIVNFEKIPDYSNYSWEYVGSSAYNSLKNAKRYLKIVYSSINNIPCIIVNIVRPEPNTLRESDSGFVYNQNLDDVFAIRDVYDSSYVNINGILPYRTSDIVDRKESLYYITTASATASSTTRFTPHYLQIVIFETYTWDEDSQMYTLKGYADFTKYVTTSTERGLYQVPYGITYTETKLGKLEVYLKLSKTTADEFMSAYGHESLQKLLDDGAFSEAVTAYFTYTVKGAIVDSTISDSVTGQSLTYFLEYKDNNNIVRLDITANTDCLIEVRTDTRIYRLSLNKGDNYLTEYDNVIIDTTGSVSGELGTGSTPYTAAITFLDSSKVLDVTENVKSNIIETFDKNNLKNIFLKAYLSIVPNKQYYCVWEKTTNGTDWEDFASGNRAIAVAEPYSVSDELSSESTVTYRRILVQPLLTYRADNTVEMSPMNEFIARPDVLYLKDAEIAEYRFRILEIDDEVGMYENTDGIEFNAFKVKTVLASKSFTPQVGYPEVILDRNDFKNTTSGEKFYYKKRIFTYGTGFKNNIHVSEFDDFTTNITNAIDLDTRADAKVTGVIAWRDFLITYTDKTIHLTTLQDNGFYTKTLSASVGISKDDAKTCVSILNGIIFKSDYKIYSMYPNFSSGSETILNISEISRPIEHILKKLEYNTLCKPFAFIDSESYYLFIPQTNNTRCLKYDFTHKIWTAYTYDVIIYDYEILDAFDIRLYAEYKGRQYEYYFNKMYTDVGLEYFDGTSVYGDLLDSDAFTNTVATPIKFLIDSGQKTDNMVLTKQFVESKIIVATLNPKDSFKMDVRIDVEGNAFKKHVDLNTDGALLRDSDRYLLTLNSLAELTDNEDILNVIRQMFLRYSGKGKTVRHIISGQSLYRFKIYEVLYRYKILNTKQ